MKKIKSENFIKFFKHAFDLFLGALLGAVISAIFIGNYLWSAFFALFVIAIVVVYFMLINYICKKRDVYKIIENELKNGNYMQVIRLGYTISRALHLGGHYQLRYDIGLLMDKACERIANDKRIMINDQKLTIEYIKAKILIDDLGWTAHLLDLDDISQNNIDNGLNIIKKLVSKFEVCEDSEIDYELYKGLKRMEIKGYRHLIGIVPDSDTVIQTASGLLDGELYKKTFSDNEKEHNKAELNYSIARACIKDDPSRALELAMEAKAVFRNDKTSDMDRYVKTFDLIGDIYATYTVDKKLLSAEESYKEGLKLCREFGRSERYIRISIDYIDLLIKMIDVPDMYTKSSWKEMDEKEEDLYKNAIKYAGIMENKEFLQRLKKSHKKYLQRRKNYS